MTRPRAIQRTIKKTFALREEVVARMELELFSPREGRVPLGAQGELISNLLADHFVKVDGLRAGSKGEPRG